MAEPIEAERLEAPPCIRHRPFRIAGPRHGALARVRAAARRRVGIAGWAASSAPSNPASGPAGARRSGHGRSGRGCALRKKQKMRKKLFLGGACAACRGRRGGRALAHWRRPVHGPPQRKVRKVRRATSFASFARAPRPGCVEAGQPVHGAASQVSAGRPTVRTEWHRTRPCARKALSARVMASAGRLGRAARRGWKRLVAYRDRSGSSACSRCEVMAMRAGAHHVRSRKRTPGHDPTSPGAHHRREQAPRLLGRPAREGRPPAHGRAPRGPARRRRPRPPRCHHQDKGGIAGQGAEQGEPLCGRSGDRRCSSAPQLAETPRERTPPAES